MKCLHPCTILDKIHVKSLNVVRKKYKMEQLLADSGITCKAKESQLYTFLHVPGVNVCFLQAFTRERPVSTTLHSPEESESDLSDAMQSDYHPDPSLSLLAIRIDDFSGQMIHHNQRNASHFKYMHEKQQDLMADHVTSSSQIPQPSGMESQKSEKEKVNSEIAGNFNVTQLQFQFSRLCNKSDIENSHTTAIPPESSKVNFVYAKENVTQFSKTLDVTELKSKDVVIFVMLECGINSISLKLGGYAVMKTSEKSKPLTERKKSGHSRSQSAPAQLLSKLVHLDDRDAPCRQPFQETIHEKYNEQPLESVVIEKQPGISLHSLAYDDDPVSSISSSSSSIVRSVSTGNLTDNESEGDDEPDSQPLLANLSPETGRIGKSLSPVKPNKKESEKPKYVLHHQSDALVHFTCIWFNCASPSSVKPVPKTYHLHNNLLTTGIPAVSSWMLGIEKIKEAVSQLRSNRRRRFYLVTACIMAQGLPEKNKMLNRVRCHLLKIHNSGNSKNRQHI